MRKLLFLVLLIASLAGGCARNHYNVPAENITEKIKVLGVAPIFIDTASDIKHPQKDQLIQVVADLNRKYEPQLVRKLKSTGNFYSVVYLDGDPVRQFDSLFFRREKRDDASLKYNKFFWKNDVLKDYLQKNNLDAVMLLVVSGLTTSEKIFSSNLLKSLESDYNYLVMSAQIVDADGFILWEYPNFRRRILDYSPLVNLQYPDFSESDANLANKTEVKFKVIDGIRRALEQKRKDWLLRETKEPEAYSAQFDDMISLLKYDVVKDSKETPLSAGPSRQPSEPSRSLAPASSVPVAAPMAVEKSNAPEMPTESTKVNGDEIVPANGSVR